MTDIDTNIDIEAIIKSLGQSAWEKLQPETKTEIITAEKCFLSFCNVKGFDFSSVIAPIMKGLELELKKNYYDGYLAYLETHYSADEYAHEIWKNEYPGDKEIARKRNKILTYNEEDKILSYQFDRSEFTIGDFRFSIGVSKLTNIYFDSTFIDYCKNTFEIQDFQKIKKWMRNLVLDIESLRKLRNDSTHAGKLQTKRDAEIALNDLVKIKKVLSRIVCPLIDYR